VTTDQQQPQAEQIAYLPWYDAGGPNECEHGYADGIPCPHCDANPKLQALVAAVARQAEQIEGQSLRYEALWSHSQKQADLLDRKDQQIERLEKALQVYAEPMNWSYVTTSDDAGEGWLFEGTDDSPEHLAKKALAALEAGQ
jgi:hypothetical protein